MALVEEKARTCYVRIPMEHFAQIQDLAREEERSWSKVIVRLVVEALQARQGQGDQEKEHRNA